MKRKMFPMKKAFTSALALSLIIAAASGCSRQGSSAVSQNGESSAAAETSSQQQAVDVSEKEAPMLKAKTDAGELPKLEERLPDQGDIMVEPDVVSLGQYGGSITLTTNDSARWTWGPLTEQSMFRFKQDGSGEVEPNICKNFYSNEDATVWTIEMRKGMKWSDGEPFTADDVIFYYDHMSTPALKPDRSAVAVDDPAYYPAYTSKPYNCYQATVDGIRYWAEFKKVDDYKFTVEFKAPKPSFPADVAVDNKWMALPKHFYKNYVARKDNVADDSSFPLITEEQAIANANRDFGKQWDSYSTLGKDIGYYNWDYAIVPQLRSFIAVKDNWDKVGETYELVRNPYFFKTDSEGRQLPYLDSIKIQIINEKDQVALKAAAGEFDAVIASGEDFSTISTSTQQTHDVKQWISADWSSEHAIQLNQTVKDEDKRKLFQDAAFREALSISVDRNLLNATLMNGQSQPAQSSVPYGSNGYDETWSSRWTEFDVAKANQLLDGITEPWNGTEGTYRKMKGTSKDLEIIISISDMSKEGDFLSLLTSAYKKIGIKISSKVDADIAKSILVNDVEAQLKKVSTVTPAIRPDDIVPMRNYACWYGAYGKWYEDGKSEANGGMAPSGDMLELINAYEAIKNAAGADRETVISENVQKIYDLHKKNLWVIGFLKPMPVNWIVNKNLKNFPADIMYSDEFRTTNLARPEQFYLVK